jgi:hypothetical protein
MTHKSENYKISAVKYYLKNKDNAINNKEIPNYLSRSKNTSTGLNEPVKPKFTRSVKGKHC